MRQEEVVYQQTQYAQAEHGFDWRSRRTSMIRRRRAYVTSNETMIVTLAEIWPLNDMS